MLPSIKVFSIVMEKPDYFPYTRPGFLPKHYKYLLQKVNVHCQRLGQRIETALVFDGQDPQSDVDISRGLNNLIFRAGELDRILEMPLFVSSEIVPGIQLADIMAGIVRHYYCEKIYESNSEMNDFQQWIKSLYDIVKAKTTNFRIGNRTEYGIQICHKNFLPREPKDF